MAGRPEDTHRQRQTERDRQTERQTKSRRERQQKDRQRQRERQTDRQTDRQRQRQSYSQRKWRDTYKHVCVSDNGTKQCGAHCSVPKGLYVCVYLYVWKDPVQNGDTTGYVWQATYGSRKLCVKVPSVLGTNLPAQLHTRT